MEGREKRSAAGAGWGAWWGRVADYATDPPLTDADAMELFAGLVRCLGERTPWRTAAHWGRLGYDRETADGLAAVSTGAMVRASYLADPALARGIRPIIDEAVRLARASILPLMTGDGAAGLRPEVPSDRTYVTVRDGVVRPAVTETPIVAHIKALRVILAPGAPFPFARCRRCNAIFARERAHQAFCNRRCRLRWNDAQRGKPKRAAGAAEEG